MMHRILQLTDSNLQLLWSVSHCCSSFNHTEPQETREKHLFHSPVAWNPWKWMSVAQCPRPWRWAALYDYTNYWYELCVKKEGRGGLSLLSHAAEEIIPGHRFKQLLKFLLFCWALPGAAGLLARASVLFSPAFHSSRSYLRSATSVYVSASKEGDTGKFIGY